MAGSIGSIRRQSEGRNTWSIAIPLPRDPTTGARRRRYITIKGSRRDAERALAAAIHEQESGIDVAPGKVTLAAFLQRWLRDYAAGKVSPSTLQRYRGIIEHHLIPVLGHLKVRELRATHIQAAYPAFEPQDGRRAALSPKTIFEHHAVLRAALNWAVRWQLLSRNPAQFTAPPRPQRSEIRVLSTEEAKRFLQAAGQTRHHALFYLLLATGARLGELLTLRWQDVDLEMGVMQITRTARFFKGQGVTFGQPKTHRSRRPIALSPETVAILREHKRRQLENRLQLGGGYEDQDLAFADGWGNATYDSTVRRAFYGIAREAGIDGARIHDLRHTAATLMLRAGVNPKVVSERLGHATVSITLDTYSHVLPDLQREAAAAMDAILGERSSSG